MRSVRSTVALGLDHGVLDIFAIAFADGKNRERQARQGTDIWDFSLVATLLPDADVPPLGERIWGDTRIELPAGGPASYRYILTERCVCARQERDRGALRAADVFAHFPIAFLKRQ